MKHMTKDELRAHGETLPLAYTYDAQGNELTYRDSYGNWRERTRDAQGNVLTFKDSNGYWRECTRDAQGNELTFKDGNGNWRGVSNEEVDKERARLKQVLKNLKRSKK